MKKLTRVVVAFATIIFASCLKNDGSVNPRAGVLVDLLSPDAKNTTIELNGNAIGSNVSYGSVPNYYNQVNAGSSNIMVANIALSPLLNNNFTTEPGKFYSLFLVDSASRMKSIIVTDT